MTTEHDDTVFVRIRSVFDAVYAVLLDVGDANVRISYVVDRVLAMGTLAGSQVSDVGKRNVIRRATEFVFAGAKRFPECAEVDDAGTVVWPEKPEENLQKLLDLQARRKAGGA